MTSELPGNKEHGKGKIRDALLGLLIALGAYALLNTINPDLLRSDINIPNATVTVVFEEELDSGPPSLTAYTGALPSGPAANCSAGVKQSATTGIIACGAISSNIDQMVAAAKQAGLTIWAGGFRTVEKQTQLRMQNCNGDTTNAKAVCHPPTARPGYSRHQSGLAFDIACNGSTITSSSSPCFQWMQANAATYGLKNLPGEAWHWSVDGR